MTDSKKLRGLREAAHDLSRAWLKSDEAPEGIPRAMLVEIGKHLWPVSYKLADDDQEAFALMARHFEALAASAPQGSIAFAAATGFLYLPDQQILQMAATRWVDQGLPTIQMGHKYAAALMSTSIEKADLSDVPVPWKAFVIDVPAGLLSVEQGGKLHEVRHVLVQHQTVMVGGKPAWTYVALTESNVTIWQHGLPMDELVKEFASGEINWSDYSFGFDTNDRDDRVNLLIGRLIVGVCLTLSGKDRPVKKVGKGHKYKGNIRTASEPLQRIFKLGKPITLDCREGVADYLDGSGKKVSVQTLVRGHWKQQAHGPGNKDRKWIQIDPYWRGPEDAPILDRPIKV